MVHMCNGSRIMRVTHACLHVHVHQVAVGQYHKSNIFSSVKIMNVLMEYCHEMLVSFLC